MPVFWFHVLVPPVRQCHRSLPSLYSAVTSSDGIRWVQLKELVSSGYLLTPSLGSQDKSASFRARGTQQQPCWGQCPGQHAPWRVEGGRASCPACWFSPGSTSGSCSRRDFLWLWLDGCLLTHSFSEHPLSLFVSGTVRGTEWSRWMVGEDSCLKGQIESQR